MWNKSLKQKIIKIFVLGLLPILIVNLTLLVKEEMRAGFISKRLGIEYNKERSTKFFREYNEKFDFFLEGDTRFQDPENYIRNLDPKTFTSNRFGYWRSIIHKSNEPIFGYGVLGDRFTVPISARIMLAPLSPPNAVNPPGDSIVKPVTAAYFATPKRATNINAI